MAHTTTHVACVTTTIAKPGHEARLQASLEELAAAVAEEAGFLQYDLHRDLDEPRRYVAIENWEDRAAFDAHCHAPHVEAWRAEVADWIEASVFHPLTRF